MSRLGCTGPGRRSLRAHPAARAAWRMVRAYLAGVALILGGLALVALLDAWAWRP